LYRVRCSGTEQIGRAVRTIHGRADHAQSVWAEVLGGESVQLIESVRHQS
jgi:hypothetical protein